MSGGLERTCGSCRCGRRVVYAALLACATVVGCSDNRARGVVPPTPLAVRAAAPDARGADGSASAPAEHRRESYDTRTVTIELPHDEPSFPDGPGRRQFLTSCVVCHSTRYITMQPHFSQAVWVSEVHKMVTDFGAHLTPEEEGDVVRYIMTIRGATVTETSKDPVSNGNKQP